MRQAAKPLAAVSKPEDTVSNVKIDSMQRGRMERMRKFVRERKKVGFFPLVIHPQSFGRSVENIFDFSFWVKEGRMVLEIATADDNIAGVQAGDPFVKWCSNADSTDASMQTSQLLMGFNRNMHREICEVFELKEPLLIRADENKSFVVDEQEVVAEESHDDSNSPSVRPDDGMDAENAAPEKRSKRRRVK